MANTKLAQLAVMREAASAEQLHKECRNVGTNDWQTQACGLTVLGNPDSHEDWGAASTS